MKKRPAPGGYATTILVCRRCGSRTRSELLVRHRRQSCRRCGGQKVPIDAEAQPEPPPAGDQGGYRRRVPRPTADALIVGRVRLRCGRIARIVELPPTSLVVESIWGEYAPGSTWGGMFGRGAWE